MSEILERAIDLCLVSHTVLNSVIGQGLGRKNFITVKKCIFRSNFQRANIC